MLRLIKKRSKKAGLPPGTLVHIGEKKTEKVKITIIDYDETQFQEKEVKTIEECLSFKDKPTVTWINIDGIHQIDIIEKIGKHFNIHPLILEDILNTGHRPKMEDLEDYIFIVSKMLYYDEEDIEIKAEQISLILGSNFVISFQECEGDIFNPIRQRIKNGKGRIRKAGADFKREMIFLRKSVWPLREVISGLERGESSLIHESTGIYLRDVYDHTIQVIDIIDTLRDTVFGMHDTYLSSISNKMNEVMKVLTIIATIFIPLTFIAGIYGMNFKYMPELEWHWGYFALWSVMIAIVVSMMFYFKRKKWL